MSQNIVQSYIDDLIIAAATEEGNLEKLKILLNRAAEFNLQINWSKCKFLHRKVEFLGHVVENGMVSPSPTKIKAVEHFPEPKNVKNVQAFLGLSGFFRKFVRVYSMIAKPLSDLTKKGEKFESSAVQRKAFNTLKLALTNNPVLAIYRQNACIEVHTDACQQGIGAILLQQDDDNNFHPVFYYSRKNNPSEQKMHSYVCA